MQIAERPAPFLLTERTEGFEEKKYLQQRDQHYRNELKRLDQILVTAARRWYKEKNLDPAEFEAARRLLDLELARAAARGLAPPASVRVGAMLEVPALAVVDVNESFGEAVRHPEKEEAQFALS